MPNPVKIFIPGNPISVNALYRGRRFLTKEGEQIKYEYAVECRRQYKGPPLAGDISVIINVVFKNRRRRDLDNILKALLDSFKGILWSDDSQIMQITVRNCKGDIPGVNLFAFPHEPE